MRTADRILIVGGYGHVGRRTAAELMQLGRFPIRIGGRSTRKAEAVAAHLQCESAHIDLDHSESWKSALNGVRVVIVCIDQSTTDFPAYVLGRGLIYLDITASDGFFRQLEALNSLAIEMDGSAVLSIGLAPGLTNLLVKACASRMDEAQSARIGIMLGLGDTHGAAAFEWTMEQFASPSTRRAPIEEITFGLSSQPTSALPVAFADQHVVCRTLGLDKAKTLLAFDPPRQSRAILSLLKYLAARPRLVRLATALMPYLSFGSDRVALVAEVRGRQDGLDTTMIATLGGRREADITALVTALIVDHVTRVGVMPASDISSRSSRSRMWRQS